MGKTFPPNDYFPAESKLHHVHIEHNTTSAWEGCMYLYTALRAPRATGLPPPETRPSIHQTGGGGTGASRIRALGQDSVGSQVWDVDVPSAPSHGYGLQLLVRLQDVQDKRRALLTATYGQMAMLCHRSLHAHPGRAASPLVNYWKLEGERA